MKKIPVPSFTFCREEHHIFIGDSYLRWCFGRRAANRHAFIPILQELFIGRLNSQKSICWELETSLLMVKYNIQGWSNK